MGPFEGVGSAGAVAASGHGPRRERGSDRARVRFVLAVLAIAFVAACTDSNRPPARPSFFLLVIDTMRADAMSALGSVPGTTPHLDALAAEGVLYTHAYAHAPWTLPSHVSLFTGLPADVHRVGRDDVRAPDDLTTLAERLRAAGYETVGFSENGWVGPELGLSQGFDRFEAIAQANLPGLHAEEAIAGWLEGRADPERPFFLFVNIVDPHTEYSVREENPFLPAGVSAEDARGVSQAPAPHMCATHPDRATLDVLHGLYLGDVHAADARAAEMRNRLAAVSDATTRLVTIVTSDHGELFGERARIGHMYSVANQLLHVPLVVHGLAGGQGVRVDSPVALIDVAPSVLAWAGLEGDPSLPGRVLPLAPRGDEERTIRAVFFDPSRPGFDAKSDMARFLLAIDARKRRQCAPDENVFGDMRSVIASPFKLDVFANGDVELFDIAADPDETSDLAERRPDEIALLAARLEAHPLPAPSTGEAREAPVLSAELRERLVQLGYLEEDVDDETAGAEAPAPSGSTRPADTPPEAGAGSASSP